MGRPPAAWTMAGRPLFAAGCALRLGAASPIIGRPERKAPSMTPSIVPSESPVTLAPGADENGLAVMLQGLLAENLAASDAKRRDAGAIATSFGVIAPDAEVQVTLEFARGR